MLPLILSPLAELKSLQEIYQHLPPGVRVPLMALIDYRGFKLLAVSLLPIGKDTLVYGSDDAAATVHSDVDEVNNTMRELAKALNLKRHIVTGVPVLYFPALCALLIRSYEVAHASGCRSAQRNRWAFLHAGFRQAVSA